MGVFQLRLRRPYDLEETLFSGQAFRWRREGGAFEGYVENEPVRLHAGGGAVEVRTAGAGDATEELSRYLRLADSMGSIYRSIGKDDRMREATDRWRGLHLLRQDPWETTVSFIASSASNVPKIARSIEKMCRAFGEPVEWGGRTWHRFPSPERLARADLAALRACEFGYRARYIRDTARRVAEGEVVLAKVARLPTIEAQKAMVDALEGIGPKVGACVLLFSMGKDDAFPVDRWVQRSVSEWYFRGAKVTPKACEAWGRQYFGARAGYAQQYLFHDRRSGGVKSRRGSRGS
jgi:N-glycosylase/DNA lyase